MIPIISSGRVEQLQGMGIADRDSTKHDNAAEPVPERELASSSTPPSSNRIRMGLGDLLQERTLFQEIRILFGIDKHIFRQTILHSRSPDNMNPTAGRFHVCFSTTPPNRILLYKVFCITRRNCFFPYRHAPSRTLIS
ncbi:hypothetical protein JOE21_001133 [Desmospora profundinema]|uniref:Uncharacterized protein n=1 Tax=Desmospora profundinema TaxID=1571184 RepID=A0ABU1IKR6_9BACL|nr:hypothetical protein [Desmospora profundinema]